MYIKWYEVEKFIGEVTKCTKAWTVDTIERGYICNSEANQLTSIRGLLQKPTYLRKNKEL